MSNLTLYHPFADPAIDDLFRGFFRPVRAEREAVSIKIDVTEKDGAYVVKAEIPGVAKDEIQVSIEGNQVTIGAEVKRETEKKDGERVLHSERYFGSAFRSFTLPVRARRNRKHGEVRKRRARAHAREEAHGRGPQADDPVRRAMPKRGGGGDLGTRRRPRSCAPPLALRASANPLDGILSVLDVVAKETPRRRRRYEAPVRIRPIRLRIRTFPT